LLKSGGPELPLKLSATVEGQGGSCSNTIAGEQLRLRIEAVMRYRLDEIASYAIEGGQIAVFAALGLVLTAIMLGSACHILRSLPRGFIRWGTAALAVLAFEAPFLWLVGVESDISLGEFAGAVVLGVIGFMLAVCCTLALMDLAGLLARLAGRTDGAETVHDRQPSGGFTMPSWNELTPKEKSPEGEKPMSRSDLDWALAELIVRLVLLV
jgi:hypothetical protein